MASLNLSTNGSSIAKSYQSIINTPPPSGATANSPTYGQWAVFSVSAPLVNAFQQDTGGKESVLKVQSTGEGELVDLIEEFSDGRVQFAFVKVKDPNTALPKYVLIGWCGEGVPERTKGYFTSHQAAVAKVLHGSHIQISARSDRDLTPEGIVEKVSNASGAKYSGNTSAPAPRGPQPVTAPKPAFTPTQSSGGGGRGAGFNPLAGSRRVVPKQGDVDKNGWGEDAPEVTRTQLEKVPSSYQPTKVNMRELTTQNQEPSRFIDSPHNAPTGNEAVVKGSYEPVGKVDIAAIRRQAQASGPSLDDRPAATKGAYEPVGKVDIAAIRARAQQPDGGTSSIPLSTLPAVTGTSRDESRGLEDRSGSFSTSERLTSIPKPKIANRFGPGASTFTGTKAPAPGAFGLESSSISSAPPVGASRAFANEGGKSPAQIWAEKKGRQGAGTDASGNPSSPEVGSGRAPITSQTSGDGGWKSGYSGKSWAPVQTSKTGQSTASLEQEAAQQEEQQGNEETPEPPPGGVEAIRDRFKNAAPIRVAEAGVSGPPPLDMSNKPGASRGVPMPGLPARHVEDHEESEPPRLPSPPQQRRSPSPEDSGSPIRVAMPVARGRETEIEDARDEQFSPPPPMPVASLVKGIHQHESQADEPERHDAGRDAAEAVAASSFGQQAVAGALPGGHVSGARALVQYDYEKAEDNELELREGEYVTNIEMVDEDWWMGQNARGETGLFPSNYVELAQDEEEETGHAAAQSQAQAREIPMIHEPVAETAPPVAASAGRSPTATALYDYEAAEDNELSFPEGATITSVEFPDDDWWQGEYQGRAGLFPANYVQLDE